MQFYAKVGWLTWHIRVLVLLTTAGSCGKVAGLLLPTISDKIVRYPIAVAARFAYQSISCERPVTSAIFPLVNIARAPITARAELTETPISNHQVHDGNAMALLGRAIRVQRLKAGMSQVALSQQLDLLPETISAWEAGTARPEAHTLLAIADALGCFVSVFFSKEGGSVNDNALRDKM